MLLFIKAPILIFPNSVIVFMVSISDFFLACTFIESKIALLLLKTNFLVDTGGVSDKEIKDILLDIYLFASFLSGGVFILAYFL